MGGVTRKPGVLKEMTERERCQECCFPALKEGRDVEMCLVEDAEKLRFNGGRGHI